LLATILNCTPPDKESVVFVPSPVAYTQQSGRSSSH
jgi:hypothetical protein